MTKVVVLQLGKGSWDKGFPVTLRIGEEGNVHSTQVEGYLPNNPEIPQYYQQWQYAYRRLPLIPRLDAPTQQETNISRRQDCSDAANALRESLNCWLDSAEFRPIDRLLQRLNRDEPIFIFIQTEDIQLRRLPWHLWDFVQQYRQAEVVLSASNFELDQISVSPQKKLRILAILGNSDGINIEHDREFLTNLPGAKNPWFLVEPARQDITEQLWHGSWDILFFAGHSHTNCETGIISINDTESLSLSELKHGLRLAIQRGLKLAIFNSCDGLGLAKELEELGIPQVIVMREPVPDRVAQDFLKNFLQAFSQGQSIYLAVRRARERLDDDGVELKIPGATWLPVICQNPATKPLVWPSQRKNRKFILIALIVVLLNLILGVSVFTVPLITKRFNDYSQQEQIVVYENDEYRLQFNHLNTWEDKMNILADGKIVKLSPKNIGDSRIKPVEVSIIANKFEEPKTLDYYHKIIVTETFRGSDQFQVQEAITPTKLANREARKLIYTESDGSTKVMEIWTLRGKTIYVIKYAAPTSLYHQFIDDVDVIVNSFELK